MANGPLKPRENSQLGKIYILPRVSLPFFSYSVSSQGIRPPQDRVMVISDFPLPQTSTELRRSVRILNFFRPMIQNFADVAYPLLRHNPSTKNFPWTESLNKLKNASTEYQLVTDISSVAVGSALYQMIDSRPSPHSSQIVLKRGQKPKGTSLVFSRYKYI